MNFLRPFFLSLVILVSPGTADEPGGAINFINGDRLSGTPGQINEQGHLVWTAANLLDQPGAIRLDTILDLQLLGGQTPETEANHDALLTLTNGDTIRGQLAALDDQHVTLDTWYGGSLRIRRSMSSSLEVMRSERALYRGPDSIENWTIHGDQNAWTNQNQELISHSAGSVAREIEFPDKCRLSLDLAWRDSLKFRVLLFSDEGESSAPENCYDLICQRRFVYLHKRWMNKRGGGGSKTIGQPGNIRELAEKEKAHLEFYINRKAGSITFYVNGSKAQTWIDEDPEIGTFGNWLHFVSEGYPLRISELRVVPWKGELPDAPNSEDEEAPIDEEGQKIHLQNGDLVVGEVGAITKGVASVKTKHADILIPVERMRAVKLTEKDSPTYETPRLMNGDIRAWLREGGHITFQLKSFTGTTLTGYSQTFGETQFDLNAFSRLEFNIHNEQLAPLRDHTKW